MTMVVMLTQEPIQNRTPHKTGTIQHRNPEQYNTQTWHDHVIQMGQH